jgi:hypothetical protein
VNTAVVPALVPPSIPFSGWTCGTPGYPLSPGMPFLLTTWKNIGLCVCVCVYVCVCAGDQTPGLVHARQAHWATSLALVSCSWRRSISKFYPFHCNFHLIPVIREILPLFSWPY